jgi:hypothetical protein
MGSEASNFQEEYNLGHKLCRFGTLKQSMPTLDNTRPKTRQEAVRRATWVVICTPITDERLYVLEL